MSEGVKQCNNNKVNAHLAGENGARSTMPHAPSVTSSAIAAPLTGAQSMPQQLCPAHSHAPPTPGTAPMMGSASGGQGRMHACAASGGAAPMDVMEPKERVAAATRVVSACTHSINGMRSGGAFTRAVQLGSLMERKVPPSCGWWYTRSGGQGHTSHWLYISYIRGTKNGV
jgi:hypothetical protein